MKKQKSQLSYKIIIVGFCLLQIAEIAFGLFYYLKTRNNPTYNPELVTYLMDNSSKTLNLSDIDKYELFISGEYHATKKNFDIRMNIIKDLSKNSDLKYIIAEDSMANAMLINSYLKTGDSLYLDFVYNHLEGTFNCNNGNYQFIKDLYEFNKTLPDDKKLTYLGMDIEHQYSVTNFCLTDIALTGGISEKLNGVTYTSENSWDDYEKMLTSFEAIYKDIEINTAFYQEKLQNKFWEFKYLIRNSINTFKCKILYNKNYLEWSAKREQSMIENFYEIYNHFPKGKYFGQWGLEHTYLNNVKTFEYPDNNEPRLATALNNNENSPIKNKVYSMAIIYLDSFSMGQDGISKNEIPSQLSNHKNELDSLKLFAQENSIQFFKLNSNNSPFAKGLYLFENLTGKGVTTDYFTDLILVKNSPACTGFKAIKNRDMSQYGNINKHVLSLVEHS